MTSESFSLDSTRRALRESGYRLFDVVNEICVQICGDGVTLEQWEKEEDYIARGYLNFQINGGQLKVLPIEEHPLFLQFHENEKRISVQELQQRFYWPVFDALMEEIRIAGIQPTKPVTKMSEVRKILERQAKMRGFKKRKVEHFGTVSTVDISEGSEILISLDTGTRLWGGDVMGIEEHAHYFNLKEKLYFSCWGPLFWPAIKAYTDWKLPKVFFGNVENEIDVPLLIAACVERGAGAICVASKAIGEEIEETLHTF